jgi:hypothetical protein
MLISNSLLPALKNAPKKVKSKEPPKITQILKIHIIFWR